MTDFVLLYRTTAEAHDEALGTPERAQASMAKWRAWMREMTDKGQLKSVGLPLERTGKVVKGKRRTVIDGPFAESKEVVAGFSIVEAKDAAEAASIAAGCPILEGGGTVEVRPVKHLDP